MTTYVLYGRGVGARPAADTATRAMISPAVTQAMFSVQNLAHEESTESAIVEHAAPFTCECMVNAVVHQAQDSVSAEAMGSLHGRCASDPVAFMAAMQSAGLNPDCAAFKPWYKKPTTWVIAGVAVGALALWRFA